ncbi:MAG: SdrD B-like domain-containing protein [Caldilineaceae bacterium]
MNVPSLIKRKFFRRRTLHKVLTLCVLASLLAGLIPPPLVSSVVNAALPEAVAQPIAAASQALLPAPKMAQAADLAPVAHQKATLEAAPAAPVARPVAAPLAASPFGQVTGNWVAIGDTSNPADGASYSTTVNGSAVVHNDTTYQVGRGGVNYNYWILDRFVTIGDYVVFLNAADPNDQYGLGSGLVSAGLIQHVGSVWSTIDYDTGNGSTPRQVLTAAEVSTMAVHYVSTVMMARFANWQATGDSNTGAYTFQDADTAYTTISGYDANFVGIRLPTEDEYYKAMYWDQANNRYNLFGTTALDANGRPNQTDLLVTASGSPNTVNGNYTDPTANGYNFGWYPNGYEYSGLFYNTVSGQGGKSPYGLYHGAGSFHDVVVGHTTSDILTNNAMIRTDNQYSNYLNCGADAADGMRSSCAGFISASGVYASPAYRLVTRTNPNPNGAVKIVKNTTGSDGTFTFTGSDASLNQSITTVGGTGSSSVITLAAGVYTVTETALSGWSTTGITVTGDTTTNSTTNVGSRQAVVHLDAGENIIVTFGNVKAASTVFDFGDAPDSYGTLVASNGPSHGIASILRIGAQIDSEADGQPSSLANGDDTNGTPNDEDGVQFKTPLRPGAKAIVAVGIHQPLNTDVHLNAWIDFNQNGTFDSGEQIATDDLVQGNNLHTDTPFDVVAFDVPANAPVGFTYARFRVCTAAGACNTPTGAAADGEVEDYRIQIVAVAKLGDKVWLDTNGDGVQQGGEPGVPGVLVQLYRTSNNALVDVAPTDANGLYSFPGLLPDTYYVKFTAPSGYTFTTPNQGSDPAANSDANQTTGLTSNITLAGGANDQTWDAGLMTTTSQQTLCDALPWGVTEIDHTFILPKFNPALGTLTGVNISAYAGLQQWIGYENFAINAQSGRVTSNSDGALTLPDNNTLNVSVGLNTGLHSLAAYDGINDFTGASAYAMSDWQYAFNASSTNYTPLADFVAASPGQTVSLPYATLSGVAVIGGGGNMISEQKTDGLGGVCVNYSYTPAPPSTIKIVKNTTGGDGTFTFTGSDASLNQSITTVGGTGSSSVITLTAGTYTVTENALSGWQLVGLACSGDANNNSQLNQGNRQAVIGLDAGENIVCTFTNAQPPTPPTGVLTVTKTISGTGTGPFNITVTGPSGVISTTTINGGQTKLFTGLVQSVYTVTEATPAGWTTVYTATTSAGSVTSNSHAVVLLQNSNTATLATTPITGKVFQDYNSDGQITTGTVNDTGVSGVTITAYDKNGNSVGSATSAADGTYTINPTGAGPYRVVFTNLPSGYEPTTHGSANGTSTQFVTTAGGASNVNLGINYPADYSQDNPNLVTQRFVQQPSTDSTPTLAMWPYANTGSTPAWTGIALQNQIGATWGLAYAPTSRKLYAAALMKRLVGLPDADNNGQGDLGAIYRIDPDAAPNATLLVDLSLPPHNLNVGAIPNDAGRGLTAPGAGLDTAAFDKVGKVGLGDMDISEDETALYVMSLADKTLYKVNIANPATALVAYPIPTNQCPNAVEARPFGVKVYHGDVYVGVVCSGEAGGALSAQVYRLDHATLPFTQIINFPLNYAKGPPSVVQWNCHTVTGWFAWTATLPASCDGGNSYVYPQPILSDIEVDADGSLILGFTDRFGHQAGSMTYGPNGNEQVMPFVGGDILRVCSTASGYRLEGDALCPNDHIPTSWSSFYWDEGPTGTSHEYYYGDYYMQQAGDIPHHETSDGGLAQLPGAAQVAVTVFDPLNASNGSDLSQIASGGVSFLNNTTGAKDRAYRIYANTDPSVMMKANGLGDLELLRNPAPIELGNRVWDDLNGNGVQDPGEPGLNGLTVSLQGPTNTVTTVTSGDGNYYFNVNRSTVYTLTVTPPSGYSLTQANASALSGASATSNYAISDTIDSDAVLAGGKATIYYTTGGPGQNNHGLDIGFTQPTGGKADILNIAPVPVPNPGGFSLSKEIVTTDGSEPPVSGLFKVVVSCPGVSGYPATLQLNADGTPVVVGNLKAGTPCTFSEDTNNLPAAPSGYTWVNAQISPASVTIASDVTATVMAQNTLAPQPTPPTNVLTVTKTISGTGTGPFNITVTGPSGVISTTTINGGQTKLFTGLASGVYTVTEATPAGWTTVYTATTSAGSVTSSSHAVVTLQNSNSATLATTPITGKVFQDFNSDGQITTGTINDTGVSGVTITAYDKNGNAVGSATSAADGTYTINPAGAGPYRVVFSNLPAGYEPATHGSQNGASTQFVTTAAGASVVNFAIYQPGSYGAKLATNEMIRGPLSAFASSTTLHELLYSGGSGSTTSYTGYSLPAATALAQNQQVGTTWGLAFRRATNTVYASAYMKTGADFGPNGTGAIYQVNRNTNAVSLFADLNTIFGANTSGPYCHDAGVSLFDQNTQTCAEFGENANAVGRTGFGDIDIIEDTTNSANDRLFAVNLYNRRLYRFPLNGALTSTTVQSFAIPGTTSALPGAAAGCPTADVIPFGLGQRNSTLYVGLVCNGQTNATSSDLRAYVYAFNPVAGTFGSAPVLEFPLTYTRVGVPAWGYWKATYSSVDFVPEPILSDIEFDEQGRLLLGFRDRMGDMKSDANEANTGGDLLVAYPNGATWRIEQASDRTAAQNDGEGPGGGEFFYQDRYVLDATPPLHYETSEGGVAVLQGSGSIVTTVFDPAYSQFAAAPFDGGLRWYSGSTGQFQRGYQIYDGDTLTTNDNFGKVDGMGDVELISDLAPLEIGNRVWNDLNGNGRQDPGEPGLNGLTVSLQGPTNTVTTVTSGDGNYYFSVSRTTAYTLTITPPSGYSVTQANAAALSGASATSNQAISDTIDSDAVLVGGKATIYYTTGSAGQNNHGLDFGFTRPTSGKADILNIAPKLVPNPGGFTVTKQVATTDGSNPTVSDSFNIVVACPGMSGYPNTQSLSVGGLLKFGNLTAGTVCSISEDTSNLPTAPSGYTWVNAQISPNSVTIASDVTATVTAKNTLAPQPPPPTNVLTVTKTISGTGTGPFNITVTGPSGVISTTTINGGQTKLFTGLASGVYTVTEVTPAGWTTVYTATPGTGGSSHAVVTLQNSNSATLATTPITGKVFRDYNSDGQITANGTVTDTGVSGVTITAYDKNGNAVGSATSAADGTYTINPTAVGPYRIVFTNLPVGYEPTAHGSQSGTTTQFVTNAAGATGVNLGINIPDDYSQANPRVAIPVHTAGANTPTNTAVRALYSFTYAAPKTGDSTGIPDMLQTGSGVENPTTDATQGQIGATWGLGYDRQDKRLFAAAVLQRQVGLGPLGLGGIYVVDYGSGAGSYTGSFTLQGVTPANGGSVIDLGNVTRVIVSGAGTSGTANGLNDDPTQPSKDIDAFAKVGKVGYGDIDMDSTRGMLWAVNLNQRALISIDVHNYTPSTNGSVPGTVNQYLLSNLSGVPTCTNGVFRPWALKLYHGDGYLGGVCSAENAAASGTYGFSDITFYVLKFDPTNPSAGFTTVASAANYNHAEEASLYHKWCDDPQANASQTACDYQLDGAFRNVPQPILTDVEFREDGSLIAGIADRYTMQQMTRNYDARSGTGTLLSTKSSGDLIFWCKVGNSYLLEGSAGCAVNDPATAPDAKLTTSPLAWLTTDGLNGSGEFFHGDWFVGNPSASLGQAQHNENATGGLALLPGAQQVLSTSADPVSYVDTDPSGGFGTQGVRWFNTQTGSRVASYQLIDYPYNTFNTPPLFAKGNGLGDLELLSDPAPIEIGNRVWNDINGNGVQDPGEPGLNGLTVSLQGPTNTVTTVTSGNGNYYFSVSRTTAYTLTITPPSGYSLTQANAAALSGASATSNQAISDTIDSDAVLVGGKATIYYTTGSAGQNNHGLDFGFTQPTSGKAAILNIAPVKIGNRLWIESDGDGDATTGTVTPVVGQVVTAISSSGKVYTATTDSNGLYTITVPANAVYTVTTGTPAGMLPSTVITNVANDSNAAANNDKNHRNTGTTVTVVNTDNLSVDFGFYTPKAQFGDRVWIESDDDGMANTGSITPVAGMVITATAGANVYTTTTNSQGYYSFTVPAGSYTVHYGAVPASYGAVRPSGGVVGSAILSGNAGSYAQTGNPDGNHPQNTTVTVANGEANWQVDYAFTAPRSDLSLTKTVDKQRAVKGDTVTYTIVLTNHGPDAATNVQVADTLPTGVTWVSDSGAGAYNHTTGLWTVASVAANSSVTLTITVQVK